MSESLPPGFEVVDDPNLPPGFKVVEDSAKPRRRLKGKLTSRLPGALAPMNLPGSTALRVEDQRADNLRLTGDARDGDTFPQVNGRTLRLYGADAPELEQQGWARDLTPVAIGRQAQAIADGLVDPLGEVGALKGWSYGRPVAPIAQGGEDVGQSLIRSGNALAAPRYLEGDERFAPYMEAERLARQNRLGLHGV